MVRYGVLDLDKYPHEYILKHTHTLHGLDDPTATDNEGWRNMEDFDDFVFEDIICLCGCVCRTYFPFAWTLGGNVSKNWEETGGGEVEVLFVPFRTTMVSKSLEVARRYNRNARGGKITLRRQVIQDKLSHIDFPV
jgi:hypothetical protein